MTEHVLYTDCHGDKIILRPSESGVFSLVMKVRYAANNTEYLTLNKEDVPEILRAFAKAADVDVLIIEKPVQTLKPHVSVSRSDTEGKVRIIQDFRFSTHLTSAELIGLMWELAYGLIELRTQPSPQQVGTLVTDLLEAGISLPGADPAARAAALLKMGYRKDSAKAAPSGKPAHVFNELTAAKRQS